MRACAQEGMGQHQDGESDASYRQSTMHDGKAGGQEAEWEEAVQHVNFCGKSRSTNSDKGDIFFMNIGRLQDR